MDDRGQEAAGPAFVLGGGGALGAYEVGMLKALFAAGVRPGLVLGTSVGAINGAAVAAEPSQASVDRLIDLWTGLGRAGVFAGSLVGRVSTAVRSRTHLYTPAPLVDLLRTHLRATAIEDLPLPFQCVAASIELAAEHWFDKGPLVPAVLASSAVPGLLPPVALDGGHFVDGGLVNSIPVGRAVALGAREIYVLQVGRIERPLTPPRLPWEVATVAFEIARRHRFARDMADLPPDVTVHVLPSGAGAGEAGGPLSQLRHRAFGQTAERIDRAYTASSHYLDAALDLPDVPDGPDVPGEPDGPDQPDGAA